MHRNRSVAVWLLIYSYCWFGDVSAESPASNSFSPVITESFICKLSFEFRSHELEMMTFTLISYWRQTQPVLTRLSLKSLCWSFSLVLSGLCSVREGSCTYCHVNFTTESSSGHSEFFFSCYVPFPISCLCIRCCHSFPAFLYAPPPYLSLSLSPPHVYFTLFNP